MNKFTNLSFVAIRFSAVLILAAYIFGQTSRPAQGQVPANLDAQAYEQARRFWSARMVKCGDSYYWKTSDRGVKPELMQAKNFEFTLTSRPVTDADRLNGLTWKGATQGKFSVYRSYRAGEGWGRWFQGPSSTIGLASSASDIVRRGRQWSVNDHFTTMAGSMFAVTCDYVRDPESSQQQAQKVYQASQQSAADVKMFNEAEKLGLFFSKSPAPPIAMMRSLYKLRDGGRFLHGFYFAPSGGWLILSDGYATSHALPQGAQSKLDELKFGIWDAAFAPNGGWLIKHVTGSHKATLWSDNIPAQVSQTLGSFNNNDTQYGAWSTRVSSLDIRSDNEWVLAFHRERWSQDFEYKWAGVGVQQNLQETLNRITAQNRKVTQVAFAPNVGWVTLYGGKCFQAFGVAQQLTDKLTELSGQAQNIYRVAIAPNGSWVIFTASGHRVDDTCLELLKPQIEAVVRPKFKVSGNIRLANEDYSIRLFNCDDGCRALIDDNVVAQTGFAEDTGWLDVTNKLIASRKIKFQVINNSGAITYGFQVRKNDTVVFEKICGTSRVIGCDNNRDFPTGVAFESSYGLP